VNNTPVQLRLLTLNINGLDAKRIGPRMEKLCLELLVGGDLMAALEGRATPPVPDVVVFQEMTRQAHMGQVRPHLRAAGFTLFPDKPPAGKEEYTLLAVRQPWVLVDSDVREFEHSPLARQYLVATVQAADGDRVRVLSAHMESLRSGGEARVAQAEELDQLLSDSDVPAVFAGDTNLREAEWAELAPGFRAQDAFIVAGSPKSAGATWWPEESPRGFRFDRVWLSAGWTVAQLRVRRMADVSDHAGVEVLLRR
jgi:tyrosyl-DNA phosphodiesterase 2